ncbi:MAG TPA: hypothetical protein VMI54_01530 [Polyangiaceae bacterium]|nr:hypothetical protein [Polyangiaceae bacterium]
MTSSVASPTIVALRELVQAMPGDDAPPDPRCQKLRKELCARGCTSFSCARGPDATWAVMASARGQGSASTSKAWRAVRSPDKGALERGPELAYTEEAPYSRNAPPFAARFQDLEGDGTQEAALYSIDGINTASYFERRVTLWRAAGGRLAELPATSVIDVFEVRDCDADGRWDIFYNPYRDSSHDATLNLGFYARRTSARWSLAARGLPGAKFELDGAFAKSYALSVCGAPPAAPFSGPLSEWPRDLHCAKLWGVSAAVLGPALEAACEKARTPAREACQQDRPLFEHMLARQLPFTLSERDRTELKPPPCSVSADW